MPLCRNVAHIAAKKREDQDEDYMLDYEELVNVPKPCVIIARLMVREFNRTQEYQFHGKEL